MLLARGLTLRPFSCSRACASMLRFTLLAHTCKVCMQVYNGKGVAYCPDSEWQTGCMSQPRPHHCKPQLGHPSVTSQTLQQSRSTITARKSCATLTKYIVHILVRILPDHQHGGCTSGEEQRPWRHKDGKDAQAATVKEGEVRGPRRCVLHRVAKQIAFTSSALHSQWCTASLPILSLQGALAFSWQ